MTAGSLPLAIVLIFAACFGGEAPDRPPERSEMEAPPAADVDPSEVDGPSGDEVADSGVPAGSASTSEASGSDIPGDPMPGEGAVRADASTEVEIEGVRLRYVPLPISRGRSPKRDLQAIEQATAELIIDRPVVYGRDRLTRGRYPLAIKSEKGEAMVLILGEPDADHGPSSAGEAGRGSRARAREAATNDVESGRREPPRDDARKATKDGRSPALEADEQDDAAGGATPAGRVTKSKSPPQVESPSKAGRSPRKGPSGSSSSGSAKGLQLPLEIVPREMRTQHVRFEIETARKGTGFRMSIHAGSTVARTQVIALEQP